MLSFRLPYDEERNLDEAMRVQINTGPDTIVQKQFAKDADINELVRRFGLLGKLPEPVTDPRFYGDVEDIPDLRTALDRIRDAQQRFAALPSRVRARFRNQPAELFAFLEDERNRPEAVQLGLLTARKEPAPPSGAPAVEGGAPPPEG
jgi:hypothetical protein